MSGEAWRCLTRSSVIAARLASRRTCAKPKVCGLHGTRSLNLRHENSVVSSAIRTPHLGSLRSLSTTSTDSTIYALSTAAGRAAIAVIRISGPASLPIYLALCPGKKEPKPRSAIVRTLYEPGVPASPDTVLDSSALVLYFPAPRTVTGEDVLELHVHGGTAVVRAILAAISRCQVPSEAGIVRYAEPGEFTRRAFINDRLDLTQVEALGDTLSANTEQQRKLSVRGTNNSLAKRYETWRQQLLYTRGELEALIDFSEDQHFDESISELLSSVAGQIKTLRHGLIAHRENAVRGELLRNGISLALLGAPNAGKSSLLNRIVGREAAIVSQEAGTTRDIVEVGIDLGGYLCRLGDTAGLRRAAAELEGVEGVKREMIGMIEQEGMRRAKARAEESNVVVAVVSFEPDAQGVTSLQLDIEVIQTAARLVAEKDNVLVVINKTDLASGEDLDSAAEMVQKAIPGLARGRIHLLSCKADNIGTEVDTFPLDAGNVQSFLRSLIGYFAELTSAVAAEDSGTVEPSVWQESLGATERHRLLLEACIASINDFTSLVADASVQDDGDVAAADGEADVVLAAEYLRGAADALAKITGRGEAGDVEEILGVVFEKFCVGK